MLSLEPGSHYPMGGTAADGSRDQDVGVEDCAHQLV
jgi:hypothetical protein